MKLLLALGIDKLTLLVLLMGNLPPRLLTNTQGAFRSVITNPLPRNKWASEKTKILSMNDVFVNGRFQENFASNTD